MVECGLRMLLLFLLLLLHRLLLLTFEELQFLLALLKELLNDLFGLFLPFLLKLAFLFILFLQLLDEFLFPPLLSVNELLVLFPVAVIDCEVLGHFHEYRLVVNITH